MKHWNQGGVFCLGILLAFVLSVGGCATDKSDPRVSAQPVLLVVLDPLAKELACACVKGYGQRDYRKLAAWLESGLKQRVSIEFSDDLAETLKLAEPGQEVIIAGERSLIVESAKRATLACQPLCALTDPAGDTSLTASFVAQSNDPAKELKDLRGRTFLFGLADTKENHAAVQSTLRAAGVESAVEKRSVYTDAALDVLDSKSSPAPIAIIPGYALRLLEGCGSITRGDLKVIGKTEPLPFITIFVSDTISAEKSQKILQTLLNLKADENLLRAMESHDGFKPVTAGEPAAPQAKASLDWPDWRGAGRDGHVPRLPVRLPETVKLVWKKAAMTGGLAGLSVSGGRLVLAERDFDETHDVYRCLDADNGELMWRIKFPARGNLDYGQSPRATPVIHEGRVYLLGAFGDLRCVDLANGQLLWQRQLITEFQAELPTWGMCSTPLVVEDLLIVNPGGPDASLVALDKVTGRTRWATPGSPAAYSAFICGEFGGHRQIVGYDQHSLGGWDVKTGQRLWQLVPPSEGDFNVPTPIAVSNGLIAATENNGTRLYHFDSSGRIIPTPVADYQDLSPDTVTPVATRERVFGVHLGLHCLDLQGGLKQVWRRADDALGDYSTLITDGDRVLVITIRGELMLVDGKANECAVISRLPVFPDDVEVYSHPALVGERLYVRGGNSVVCVDLGNNDITAK